MALSRDKHKLVITVDNIGAADAIALKKMFEYMQYLGNIGSSRKCSFYADGDGSFHPKISFDYPIELPEVPEITGVVETREGGRRGQFDIDSDDIGWIIYHDPEEFIIKTTEWEDEKPGYPRKMNGLGNF